MSELGFIQETLQRAAYRRRLARALRGLWTGLLIGGCIWLVAFAIFKVGFLPAWLLRRPDIWMTWLMWSGVIAAACPIIGFILAGWRKPSMAETARWLDVKQNLRERLSTALELAPEAETSPWEQLILTDAASHAKDIDPRKLVRFSLTRATRWALLVLILAVGLGFVPEYRSKAQKQQAADTKNIKEIGKKVAELTRRDIQQRKPALENTQKSLESVASLGDQLTKANLTRTEALKDLASATDKLKDQLKEMGKDPGLKKMEQAARSPTGSDAQKAEGLQKQMEQLQKQLGDKPGSPEAMEKLQKDLQKLQEAAKGLADKNGPASEAEKQKLAESLASLSQQAQQAGVKLPQLDDAIAALAADETSRFMKDMEAATKDLEKLRDMAKQLQALQAQAQKLGKDLAEQLKYGQAEAAANTLNKLAEQLKAGKLSDEDLQKIMKEVAEAVPQAGDYGKVADLLKKGAGQMKGGDKPGASQSLADAAKELENLMQQMGDAESIMAAMDNLKQASMCIGQCQGWGMCNKPGIGKGGKPGSGVGTWADEDGGWGYDGQWTERWDNTGYDRPDMAPRGLTERDPTLNDALTPTKVKGQFSQGGQMPSITLKGVNIKGTSKVQYEETVTASQSDGQSALSQDKVPRAYQGAVKDYFDDQKK